MADIWGGDPPAGSVVAFWDELAADFEHTYGYAATDWRRVQQHALELHLHYFDTEPATTHVAMFCPPDQPDLATDTDDAAVAALRKLLIQQYHDGQQLREFGFVAAADRDEC